MNDNLNLATEIRNVVTRLVKKVRYKTQVGSHLSLTERTTIGLLDTHKELLPSELAAIEKVTTQSMSQILNHLAELDYIIRKPSPTDGRKTFISLSKAGKVYLQKARSEKDEWLLKALHETCSRKEMGTIHNALQSLKKLIEFE